MFRFVLQPRGERALRLALDGNPQAAAVAARRRQRVGPAHPKATDETLDDDVLTGLRQWIAGVARCQLERAHARRLIALGDDIGEYPLVGTEQLGDGRRAAAAHGAAARGFLKAVDRRRAGADLPA